MPGIFITGTDTEIGKTHVTCALLNALNQQNLKTIGMKPVASGADEVEGQLKNEDALKLIEASFMKLPYEKINPYVFKVAASPHIAAELDQQQVEIKKIVDSYRLLEQQAEMVLVEGVGGWLAPLNKTQTVSDLALELGLPVILVVGMRLGCLNHAMLTANNIHQSGLKLIGWIANCLDDDFSFLEENISTLQQHLDVPLIAKLSYQQTKFSPECEQSISLLAKAE